MSSIDGTKNLPRVLEIGACEIPGAPIRPRFRDESSRTGYAGGTLMQPYSSENSSEHSPDPTAHLDGHALRHPAVHPDTTLLESFLRGALSAAECRTVVRHLLTGCPRCVKVTGRCWPPGSKIPR
jgi:hypothetical protein